MRTIHMLDPSESSDRRALSKVARSSRALYDLATAVLYRELELDNSRLLRVLAGGHLLSGADDEWGVFTADSGGEESKEGISARWAHLAAPSQRWRRSLRMVRSLTLLAPISTKALALLWDVCVPNEPLFPNVREVGTLDAPRSPDLSWNQQNEFLRLRFPPKAVVLFECPNVCGQSQFAGPLLISLKARSWRHVSFHTYPFCVGWSPRHWVTCRIFDYRAARRLQSRRSCCPCPKHENREPISLELLAMYLDQEVEALTAVGPLQLCLADREYEDDEDMSEQWNEAQHLEDKKAMEDWRMLAELVKPHYGGNLSIVFGDVNDPNPPDCPPCAVCGESRGQFLC